MDFTLNDLHHIAAQQEFLMTRKELAHCGWQSHHVGRKIATAQWSAVSAKVISLKPGPPSRQQLIWAASKHFENGALTGEAVLELHGLNRDMNAPIDILTPRGGKKIDIDVWKIHTSRNLPPITSTSPNQTSLPFSVAFAAGTALTDKQGTFFAIWAIQKGLVSLDQLILEVAGLPATPHGKRARKRVARVIPNAQSMPEQEFVLACRRFGLPQPQLQSPRLDSAGRQRYLDALFVTPHRTLAVEIDGIGHLDTNVRVDDVFKANSMMLEGIQVIRIPAQALRENPGRFMRQIKSALER